MIRLVIFDWAGTLIDFGSLAPLEAYREVFAQQGVEVSSAEIRVPMGMHKRDHLRAVLTMPEVVARWKTARGGLWDDADVDRMYHEFMPIQLRKLREFDRLIPETLECVRNYGNRGIKIGTSTGYFREATELVVAAAHNQGLSPDCTICADDVPSGHPAVDGLSCDGTTWRLPAVGSRQSGRHRRRRPGGRQCGRLVGWDHDVGQRSRIVGIAMERTDTNAKIGLSSPCSRKTIRCETLRCH